MRPCVLLGAARGGVLGLLKSALADIADTVLAVLDGALCAGLRVSRIRGVEGRGRIHTCFAPVFHTTLTVPIHPRARRKLTTFGVHATVSPARIGKNPIL